MTGLVVKLCGSQRNALATVLVWFILIALLVRFAPSISDVTTNEQEEFLPVGVESVEAIALQRARYPAMDGIPAIAVFHSPDGLSVAELRGVRSFSEFLASDGAPDAIANVLSVFDYPEASRSLQSPDGKTMIVLFLVRGVPSGDEFQDAVGVAVEKASKYGGSVGIDTAVTGPASILTDAIKIFQSIDIQVTLVTMVLVLVILFVIYRSPGLVLVPLMLVSTALLAARSLAALIVGTFGLSLNDQVVSIMSVLLFGAGTNYVLFIISRYREELGGNSDRFSAMSAAMGKVAPSITGSAATTIVAMLLLLFSMSGSFKTMGPMLALAVAVVLISGLTVLPAAIVLMSKWAFWPLSVETNVQRAVKAGFWGAVGKLVSHRPWPIFIITTAALGAAIVPTFNVIPSFNFLDGFPADVESKVGYNLMKKGFPAGELSPITVFVNTGSGNIMDHQEVIESIGYSIGEVSGVNRVQTVAGSYGSFVSGSESAIFVSRFNSPDGSTTRLDVVLDGDPYTEESLNKIQEIRGVAAAVLSRSGLTDIEVLVGGDTAIQFDNKAAIDRDLRLLAPLILLAILGVLIVLQRSLITPLYLLFSIVLSYAATYGLSVLIFQGVLGHTGVAYSNGIWIFVFLVAFGADYNIFVMARIREETQKRGFKDGITVAVGRTGGVITSAGIILAGTFAVLATLPLRDISQLGIAVMLGVLIDTFIVRALLVPSIATLLHRYNWWPSNPSHRDYIG
jgi:RND superfamily putative drug exporter